jgi:hypothetical protein
MSFTKKIFKFLSERKKYWLLPLIIFLVLLSGMIILSQGSTYIPFNYSIF